MIASMPGRLVSPITVGRAAELETAMGALDELLAGHPAHLLIAGEAGVGKTRLVDDIALAADARGMRILRGHCANLGEGGLPYAPIVEILRELVLTLDGDTLAEVVGPSGPDLARLVPALSPVAIGVPIQQQWLQVRILEALLGLLHRLGDQAPVMLVVEDVHWADPATREVISFLVGNLRTQRVLSCLTYRSDELHRRHPLLRWLAELERTGRVVRIDLERFDAGEVHELLAAILGREPEPDLVRRVHRRSDGNPFFAQELLAAGQDGGAHGGLSATLEEVLLARIAEVPEEAQPILAAAAVAGRRVDHDLLAAVVEGTEADLLVGLRAAVTSNVLVVDAGADGDGYAFRHALFQEVVYEDLLPGERRQLHRACAGALAERGTIAGAEAAAHWAELAYHWANARDDPRAFEAVLHAAKAAEEAFAFEAALHRYEDALGLWASIPDPVGVAGVDQAELLARAAEAANLAGHPARDVALRRQALAVLEPAADPVRVAVLHAQLGRSLYAYGDSAEALAEHERAVAIMPVDPPTAERARVLAGYGQILMLLDRWQASSALCEEAIAIAERVAAREAEGHARNTLGLDRAGQGRGDEGIALLEHALAIAVEVGNVDDIGRAHVNLSETLYLCGLPERAAEAVDRGIRAADAFGIASSYGSFIRYNGIQVNFELGRWETAARLAGESLEAVLVGASNNDRYRISRWAPLLVASGDFELAAAQLDRLAELLEGAPVEGQFAGNYHAAAAELALWQGRPGDALDEVERGLARLGDGGWSWFNMRLFRIGAWAAADCAEVGRARRDRAGEGEAVRRGGVLRAHRERSLAAILADQHGTQAKVTLAESETAEAEDRRLHGVPDPEAWRTARDRWGACARPYLLAYCAWREGEARLAAGDRAAATDALRIASDTAIGLGARPLASAVASLANRARLDLRPPRPEPARAAEPFGLSRREREVLASSRWAAPTARSRTPCSSARTPRGCTSRTSWASSASRAARRPLRWRFASSWEPPNGSQPDRSNGRRPTKGAAPRRPRN
jgi:tetratricopeptide (TPR) repeat protein